MMNIKKNLLWCLVGVTSMLFCMQRPQLPAIEQLRGLLAFVDKDPKAIADLLWDSIADQKHVQDILELIHAQKQPQLERGIAAEILEHVAYIHTLLFDNVTITFPISMRWTRINHLFCLSDARHILGCVEPDTMLCWDTEKSSPRVSWCEFIPSEYGYNVSLSCDSLVYRCGDTLVRYSGGARLDRKLMLAPEESVYSELGGRFVLAGPNLERLKELKKDEKYYKILDFERSDRKLVLPGTSYFNSIHVSADNAYIVVNEERYEGQKRCLVKQLISTVTGEVFDIYDQGGDRIYGHVFAPSSKYLAAGIESSRVLILDLSQIAPRVVTTVTCDEGTYNNITFLDNDMCMVEHLSSTRVRSIKVLSLKTGQVVYSSSAAMQYIVAPQGKFIAVMGESDIALYDVVQQRVTKNIQLPTLVTLCAVSKNGKYLAVKEKDDERCLSVYACESESLLLRVPSACNKFIFYDQDAYLIGIVMDEFNKNKSICFWNVETGRYIGSWNAGSMHTVCSRNGCPQVMVNYTTSPKAFLITRIDDVVKLDRMLCDLAHIETALKLAIVSNKNLLAEHTERFLQYVAGEYAKGQACSYGQYTTSLLASLDRLVVYDRCLKWLMPTQELSATCAAMHKPARKRVKKEQEITRDLLDVSKKNIKQSSERTDFLYSRALQEWVTRFFTFCEQLQQLAGLPVHDQKEITRKVCPAEIFKYMGLLRDELHADAQCLSEGSWQYQAFRLILIWLPVCEKNFQAVIKAYNRDRVIGYYNNVYPSDDSMHNLVAHKIRELIACIQDGDGDKIELAKQNVEVIYQKVVGNVFELDKILPLLTMKKQIASSCKAYQIYCDLSHRTIMPPMICMQQLLDDLKLFIQDKKSQRHIAPYWAIEQLEKFEKIVAIDDVSKLDRQQQLSLIFLPTFKDFFDFCCC